MVKGMKILFHESVLENVLIKIIELAISILTFLFVLCLFRRSVESIVGVGPNMVGFTPPPIGGKLYSLTTPPGVPSPSPPPSVQGATVQPGRMMCWAEYLNFVL